MKTKALCDFLHNGVNYKKGDPVETEGSRLAAMVAGGLVAPMKLAAPQPTKPAADSDKPPATKVAAPQTAKNPTSETPADKPKPVKGSKPKAG